ncbi:hypothetical protein LTS18_004042, partial [Coniosporium uncinatum]
MRLLEIDSQGRICLTKHYNSQIPCYAILSHTWGPDDEEVVLEDMVGGAAQDKAGFKKVLFCAEQAKKDGLQYFWIDGCCIDKKSSAELMKAINSMFEWYRKAVKCY